MFLRLGKAGWYCITIGYVFFCVLFSLFYRWPFSTWEDNSRHLFLQNFVRYPLSPSLVVFLSSERLLLNLKCVSHIKNSPSQFSPEAASQIRSQRYLANNAASNLHSKKFFKLLDNLKNDRVPVTTPQIIIRLSTTQTKKLWKNSKRRTTYTSPAIKALSSASYNKTHTHRSPLIASMTLTPTKKCSACQPRQSKIKLTQPGRRSAYKIKSPLLSKKASLRQTRICPGSTISSRPIKQAPILYDLSYPTSMDPPNAFHGFLPTPLNPMLKNVNLQPRLWISRDVRFNRVLLCHQVW